MAEYNSAIANYLKDISSDAHQYNFSKSESLRYGENPHQTADLLTFSNLEHKNIANADILQGKELSYNNIVDADAAWECVRAFDEPACVIVKHANPCGVAEANSIFDAYDLAFKTDPTSAFGGIIAFNRELNKKTAEEINKGESATKFDKWAQKNTGTVIDTSTASKDNNSAANIMGTPANPATDKQGSLFI